jgi:hypothetical protein
VHGSLLEHCKLKFDVFIVRFLWLGWLGTSPSTSLALYQFTLSLFQQSIRKSVTFFLPLVKPLLLKDLLEWLCCFKTALFFPWKTNSFSCWWFIVQKRFSWFLKVIRTGIVIIIWLYWRRNTSLIFYIFDIIVHITMQVVNRQINVNVIRLTGTKID